MDAVRFELAALESFPTKSSWDAAAAELVATMLARWHLSPGEAFAGGEAGAAIAVTTADGRPAVLKLGFPHDEAVAEAIGLECWSPALAPPVLRQDAWTWALLLERVEPGIPLSHSGLPVADALEAATTLLGRLHAATPPPGVPGIGEIVGPWLANAAGGSRLDAPARALVAPPLDDALDLLATDRGTAMLHGDFNPGNVLWDEAAATWKTIDPKPMSGDAEFDLQPLVEQVGGSRTDPVALEGRLRAMVAPLGLDFERATRWCAARCALNVAWASDDRDAAAAGAALRELEAWKTLSGA